MTDPQDDGALAQPLHRHEPDPDRRHRRRAARACCSGRATCSSRAASIIGFPIALVALFVSFFGPKWSARALADAARAVKRFYRTAERRRGQRHPARRPAGEDARARRSRAARRALAEAIADGMECAGRDDRPARDAADRPRQCRDRPGRAGPRRLRRRPRRLWRERPALLPRRRARAPLVARQAEHWDPILAWARQRYDVDVRARRRASSTCRSRPTTIERLARRGRGARSLRARRPVAAGDDLAARC